jgi:hypothetical protein
VEVEEELDVLLMVYLLEAQAQLADQEAAVEEDQVILHKAIQELLTQAVEAVQVLRHQHQAVAQAVQALLSFVIHIHKDTYKCLLLVAFVEIIVL